MSAPIFPLPHDVRERMGLAPLGSVVSPRLKTALRSVLHAILGELNELIDHDGNLPLPLDRHTRIETGRPLGTCERKLLDVATRSPQTGKRLARLAKVTHNSRTRQVITELVRDRFLVRTPDGYMLAD